MGLPKCEITECTIEELEAAIAHQNAPRVMRYRGRDFDDMDLEDWRDFGLWVAKAMVGQYAVPRRAPKPKKKKADTAAK